MKIVVTGGLGSVGRPLVARLVRHAAVVKVLDRVEGVGEDTGAEYVSCDLTRYNRLREQVRGYDAVIHLAAIPFPGGGPGEEIFRNNCTSTYNVFEAAAQEGIRRVVVASSINALGFHYGVKDSEIKYLPVDEDHPICTSDPYSFSKHITEEIAAYYWRREGITSFCLRLPGVVSATKENRFRFREWLPRTRQAVAEWLALPEREQRECIQQLYRALTDLRMLRFQELPIEERRKIGKDFSNPEVRMTNNLTDFWTLIEAEDSAQAFEKCLLVEVEGSYPLFVNDGHNTLGLPSETLARVFFPQVRERRHVLAGSEGLVSIAKARQLIGFEPEYIFNERLQ
jgi:UDP-glucose 4-epimerase